MKNYLFILFFILVSVTGLKSQPKTYWSSGGEMIFSFADIKSGGNSDGSVIRWSPVFNIQGMLNADFNKNLGIFTGLGIRNVGFIYDDFVQSETDRSTTSVKKKFRSYNLAVPLGIKLGNLGKVFIFGGYEVELPFHYKEKTFVGGDKTNKITGWFSNRQQKIQHGFIVGVQLPYDMSVKFKYYVSEFFNQDFTDGNGLKPYSGFEAHVFYFSLSSYLFKNMESYKPESKPAVY